LCRRRRLPNETAPLALNTRTAESDIRASSLIRHSSFGFRHCSSIRVIRGSPVSLSSCLFVLICGLTSAKRSPKGNFSLEEQLLLHAYSHDPLGDCNQKIGERPLTKKESFCELRRGVPGVEGRTAMPTRSAPTTFNAPLSYAPELVSLRLFLTGINPQIAWHRGCDQTWSRHRGHLGNHA
jgi:hypothetical protein